MVSGLSSLLPLPLSSHVPPPSAQGLRPARYFRVSLAQLPDMRDGTRQIPSIVEACVAYIKQTGTIIDDHAHFYAYFCHFDEQFR